MLHILAAYRLRLPMLQYIQLEYPANNMEYSLDIKTFSG
jgi:hypothetical protein